MNWLRLVVYCALCILIAIVICPTCGQAQDDPAISSTQPVLDQEDAAAQVIAGTVLEVDGTAAAGARVRIDNKQRRQVVELTCDQSGHFRTQLPLNVDRVFPVRLRVENKAGSHVVLQKISNQDPVLDRQNLRLQLQPGKTVTLLVKDRDGLPIPNAHALIRILKENLTAETDEQGVAKFLIPADQLVSVVVAWKNDAGLDYEYFQSGESVGNPQLVGSRSFPADHSVALQLTGSRTVEVYVTDRQSAPISDASVFPWLLKKGRGPELNASFFQLEMLEKTDGQGHVALRWIPEWHEGNLNFFARIDGNEKQFWSPAKRAGPLRVQIDHLITISGQVKLPDGTPLVGISIWARGWNHQGLSVDRQTVSKKDGRYELKISPDVHVMLGMSDKKWAAASYPSIVTRLNENITEKDFVVRPASRVYGILKSTSDKQPVSDKQVTLEHVGLTGEEAQITLPDAGRNALVLPTGRTVSTPTDQNGQFEFYVGDGQYKLNGGEVFDVRGETEIEIDLSIAYQRPLETRGRITMADPSQSPEKVIIQAQANDMSQPLWTTYADAQGQFSITRQPKPTYLLAMSADGRYGATRFLADYDKQVQLELKQTGNLIGRVLKKDGTPWANTQVICAIAEVNSRGSYFHFQQSTHTDGLGRFEFKQLAPERTWTLFLIDGNPRRIGSVRLMPGETKDLDF